MAFKASSSSFWRRPVMKTWAPSFTKSFAVANPIPSVPPVMTAILPSSFLDIGFSIFAIESARQHPSIHRQRCADDVGGLVRADEDDGIGDLFGEAHALGWNFCLQEIRFVFLILCKVVEHPGFRRSGTDDVDANSRARQFDGRRLGDTFHGVFAADIHSRGRAADFAVR